MSMAMSDTGSSFAQWVGLYHHEPSLEPPTAAAAASPASAGSGGSPIKASQQQLGVEGPRAAGKPAARRRTRASRRAPVTLLNTDTANFRAMVQQFTGIPAPPAGPFVAGHAHAGAPVINFAADYGFPPPAGLMSFDHFHSHAPAPLQDQLIRRQQQQQHYAGATFGYGNSLQGAGAGDMFASTEERMLVQSMQTAQMPHGMPPAPSAAANSGGNGYFA